MKCKAEEKSISKMIYFASLEKRMVKAGKESPLGTDCNQSIENRRAVLGTLAVLETAFQQRDLSPLVGEAHEGHQTSMI
jgi:hypothetical protein